jgi:hypothetical protein
MFIQEYNFKKESFFKPIKEDEFAFGEMAGGIMIMGRKCNKKWTSTI